MMSQVISIATVESIREVLTDSLAVILKHSTRCPISAGAKREFDNFAATYCGEGALYLVDIIANRDVSDEISSQTGVIHQSPQVLAVIDGSVAWHASHWGITQKALKDAVERVNKRF